MPTINDLLAQKKLSQRQFSEEINESEAVVSRWCHGSMPRAETLMKVAAYFGVSPESIERALPSGSPSPSPSPRRPSAQASPKSAALPFDDPAYLLRFAAKRASALELDSSKIQERIIDELIDLLVAKREPNAFILNHHNDTRHEILLTIAKISQAELRHARSSASEGPLAPTGDDLDEEDHLFGPK